MKKLVLPESSIDKLNNTNKYAVFTIPEFERDNEVDVSLHDVVQIVLAENQGNLKNMGLGEVVSIKTCSLIDVSPEDIKNGPSNINSKRDLATMLRSLYKEYRADIVARTPIKVITVRKFDYDLEKLNRSVKLPKQVQ